jgi:hypothetical protein
MTNARDLETWLQAEKAQSAARPHSLSMGAAFVRGRLKSARRGHLLALAAYLACGCALAVITTLLWSRPGPADIATALATGASVFWIAGLVLGR